MSYNPISCPQKARLLLAHDEQFWILLRNSEAKRLLLTRNEAKFSILSQTESLVSKTAQRAAKRITVRHFATENATHAARWLEQLFGGQNR
jgi:hypothetical protein